MQGRPAERAGFAVDFCSAPCQQGSHVGKAVLHRQIQRSDAAGIHNPDVGPAVYQHPGHLSGAVPRCRGEDGSASVLFLVVHIGAALEQCPDSLGEPAEHRPDQRPGLTCVGHIGTHTPGQQQLHQVGLARPGSIV